MSLRTFSRTALLSFVLATAQIAAMHGVFAMTGSPEDWKPEHTVSNGAYRLEAGVLDGQVFVRLRDLQMRLEISDDAYVYRASCPVETGTMVSERLTDPAITVAEQTMKVSGQLARLRIEHTFSLPADKPYMEERIVLRNETGTPISMSDFEAGFQRRIANEMGGIVPYVAEIGSLQFPSGIAPHRHECETESGQILGILTTTSLWSISSPSRGTSTGWPAVRS